MFENCNFLLKELVETYSYSDKADDRSVERVHTYKGRKFIELGEYTVSAYVANVYKVTEKTSGMVCYVTCIGMARQHPNDPKINMPLAWEVAAENALTDPIMSFKSYTRPGQYTVLNMIKLHNETNIQTIVRTPQEVKDWALNK